MKWLCHKFQTLWHYVIFMVVVAILSKPQGNANTIYN